MKGADSLVPPKPSVGSGGWFPTPTGASARYPGAARSTTAPLGAVPPDDKVVMLSSSQPFVRSEEHTSELQSHVNLVCRLLLEKKKKKWLTKTSPAPTLSTNSSTPSMTYPSPSQHSSRIPS